MANASYTGEQRADFGHDKVQVTHHGAADNVARLFGDFTNCTIGNITVNVNPTITAVISSTTEVENEFDELVKAIVFS